MIGSLDDGTGRRARRITERTVPSICIGGGWQIKAPTAVKCHEIRFFSWQASRQAGNKQAGRHTREVTKDTPDLLL